ncbi:uncharacterized protein KY384_004944 [Bacidia gigantensis]|uniref:uncharacterized protein n=1 Tax=Bacidia gigantensis TaxID=2732470 RepID=UPI001D059798|nr:uncharacterized protein KY384_004944 [Bacidia gigantensis]KAG8530442.1 hypothetical protein KY384_004944 [Bacidia gigantensis]
MALVASGGDAGGANVKDTTEKDNPEASEKKAKRLSTGAKGARKEKPVGTGAQQDAQKAAGATKDAEVSWKERKAQAKAEKLEKRAKEKQGRQGQSVTDLRPKSGSQASIQNNRRNVDSAAHPEKSNHRRRSSAGAHAQKALSLRPAASDAVSKAQGDKKEDKRVAFLEHLYGHPRRHTIAGAAKDIHPSVLALGLQISHYEICGSNARCVATLLVLKDVIMAYTTPIGTSLPRHLTTHLASQIDYLVSCRPLSVSQGNAIRWLKVIISAVDVSAPEEEAKSKLCAAIDNFVRERIIVADEVIAATASERIQSGDVIMTYGKSSIVEKTLVEAHFQGKKLKVIVVDSRPLLEGRNLSRCLIGLGIEVQYSLLTGLSHVVSDVTKIFLGAHAMMPNGRLYSRAGTAMVAMAGKDAGKPVIVCCETVKLTERVALDSLVYNEIAPEDELVMRQAADDEAPSLENWRDVPNLQLLNLMYDLTPAEFIDMVITEYGSTPLAR